MAEVFFDWAAIQELSDKLSSAGEACSRARDEQANGFDRCRQRYSRLSTEAEQKVHRAHVRMEEAEWAVCAARSRYDLAEQALGDAEDEDDYEHALEWLREAREKLADAEADQERAQSALRKAQEIMSRLTAAWESHGPAAESALGQIEDNLYSYHTLAANGSRDLSAFRAMMGQARYALYGCGPGTGVGAAAAAAASGTAAAVGVGSALGWCTRHSMQAVSADANGRKSVSIRIGGKNAIFPCSKSGMARAYRAAVRSGDADLMARTSAMFEIETLREGLELTSGEDAVQLGGYHRDVKSQDPKGYESHHIPSRSVQDANADWLPAISISREDHKQTFSYAGRQRHVYQPVLPSSAPRLSYQQEMSREVGKGSSGYVAAVRDELYDLRVSTGHKYDGGISAYLDAVIDMLAARGLPGGK